MAEQTSISYYQTEFKFNGKELDSETGLYYYGARYYDPSLSIWMSVDPLVEKFPNFSPYNYTMNNPINMIDPDGRAAEGVQGPNDWIKNLLTNEYEWRNEVTSAENTPDGYRYVGKGNMSIIYDLMRVNHFKDDTTDFGMLGVNSTTTAHGFFVAGQYADVNSEMNVYVLPVIMEVYSDGQLDGKHFSGIQLSINARGSSPNYAFLKGGKLTVKPEEMTLNGTNLGLDRSNYSWGNIKMPGSNYQAFVGASDLQQMCDINISFQGLATHIDSRSYLSIPTIIGGIAKPRNVTEMGLNINLNN